MSILLIMLLLIIVLLVHACPRCIVLPRKAAILRKVPNLFVVVAWEVNIIRWVVGMNTSSIHLDWIGRNYSGSDR